MIDYEKKLLKDKYDNNYEKFFKNEYPASYDIWSQKYKHKDETIEGTWKRIAKYIASNETTEELQKEWEKKFYKLLYGFKYLPGGRIQSNAGTNRTNTTLINCFVENLEDELDFERAEKDFFFSKEYPNLATWYLSKINNQYHSKQELERFLSSFEELTLLRLFSWCKNIIKPLDPSEALDFDKLHNTAEAIEFLSSDSNIKYITKTYAIYEADSMYGIMQKASNWSLVLKTGGGVGGAFSNLRPNGSYVKGVDSDSSGPLAFMRTFDQICKTVKSAGARRGAMMGVFHINHPDVVNFIKAKRDSWDIEKLKVHISNMKFVNDNEKKYYKELVDNAKSFTSFNISIAVTDEFMQCLESDGIWNFKWNGKNYGNPIKAKDLWNMITQNTYECSEPGIIFIDRVNQLNNLWYCEDIHSSNPCSEQMLSNGSVCCLGSFNLTEYIEGELFSDKCEFDFESFKKDVCVAVRLQDNVLDLTAYPLKHQKKHALNKRRIGIGVTGLGDIYMFMHIKYGSDECIKFTEKIMSLLCNCAYESSAALSQEKGSFPWFDKNLYLQSKFVQRLPENIRILIQKYGIRNSHILSCQPTGTISFVAKNISSGIEPIFMYEYDRYVKTGKVDSTTGIEEKILVSCQNYAYKIWKEMHPKAKIPEYFSCTETLDVADHLNVEIAMAPFVDSAISKCVMEGTLINTNKGIFKIEELCDNKVENNFVNISDKNYLVIDADGNRNLIKSHYNGGIKPCYKIKFSNGYEIFASNTHKLLTEYGWKQLDEIQINEKVFYRTNDNYDSVPYIGVVQPSISEVYCNSKIYKFPTIWDEDFSLFLGMWLADGCTNKNSISICEKNDVVSSLIDELIKKLFGIESKISIDKRSGVRTHLFHSRYLAKYFKENFGTNALTKVVPNEILKSNKSVQLSFIKGLTLDGYKKPNSLVIYDGYSKNIVNCVAEMLQRFGYRYYIGSKLVSTGRLSKISHSISVSLDEHSEIFPIELHKINYNKCGYGSIQRYINKDLQKYILESIPHTVYGSWKRRNIRNSFAKDSFILESTLNSIGLSNYDHNLSCVNVTSVEFIGNRQVYDIEVDNTHSYLIGGIVSHNTVNISSNYDFEKFKDVYNIVWKSGSLKNVSTYRENSMVGVLIKKQTLEYDEDNIKEEAPKRPYILVGATKKIKENGENFYILVNLLDDKPFEIFCITNNRIPKSITAEVYEALVGLAKKVGIKEKHLKEQLEKGNNNVDRVTRLISLGLRHGIALKSILFELDQIETSAGSVLFHIKKTLGEYIKDGTPVNGGKVCEQCKQSDTLIFQSGCVSCRCGWSKC